MTKRFISLLVFFLAVSAKGQELQKLYFDKSWKLCTAQNASYTRTVVIEKNLNFEGDFTDTNLEGVIITEGSYLDNQKNGKFTYRFESGAKHIIGSYQNDSPIGIWTFFIHQVKSCTRSNLMIMNFPSLNSTTKRENRS